MHMVLFTWWCWHIFKGEVLELMLINLPEKEMTGGRSGHVGRTVRQYNSILSKEIAALFGIEGRTTDGPPLGCGQSAGQGRTVCLSFEKNFQRCFHLWWVGTINCGRSAPRARTVRQGSNG